MISQGIDKIMKSGGLGLISDVVDYIEKKQTNKEKFSSSGEKNMAGVVYTMFNSIIWIVAFSMAFKCGGFSDFMGACCCSICYIAYRLGNPCP